MVHEYRSAERAAEVARLRRLIALRAMVSDGMTQRQIATALGISQSAVSQQLSAGEVLREAHPELLLEAAVPVLKSVAESQGYTGLAVFGSVARGTADRRSDIDLLVEAPMGTSSFSFMRFKLEIEQILGREIDLVSTAALQPGLDADIQRDAVLL